MESIITQLESISTRMTALLLVTF